LKLSLMDELGKSLSPKEVTLATIQEIEDLIFYGPLVIGDLVKENKKSSYFFGAFPVNSEVFKSKFSKEDLNLLIDQGFNGYQSEINEEQLHIFLKKIEFSVKQKLSDKINYFLKSRENRYLILFDLLSEKNDRERIKLQTEIEEKDFFIEGGFNELKKLEKENSQLKSRVDELREQIEKFKPYLNGKSNLNWSELLDSKNSRQLLIKDMSSLTIEDFEKVIHEQESLIFQILDEITSLKMNEIIFEDDKKELISQVEILKQEKKNNHKLYESWETAKKNLLKRVENNGKYFEQAAIENSNLFQEKLRLENDLKLSKSDLNCLRLRILELEKLDQKIKELNFDIEEKNKKISELQKNNFLERIKLNAILTLNVSASLIPSSLYKKFVKTVDSSILALRMFSSSEKELCYWIILATLSILSIIYSLYAITKLLYSNISAYYRKIFWRKENT
jgi:hypothetical protein